MSTKQSNPENTPANGDRGASSSRCAQDLYRQGQTQLDAGRYAEALALFEQAVVADADFALAHNGRGEALRAQGEIESAVAAFTEAIRLDPKCALALANRGTVYHRYGRASRALADLYEAVRVGPAAGVVFAQRGRFLFDMQRYGEAADDLGRCIELDWHRPWAYALRGVALHHLGNLDDALADLDRSIQLESTDAWAFNCRGCVHHAASEFEAAIRDYDEALILSPEYANAYLNRGRACYEIEEFDRAMSDYDRAIRLEPGDADSFYYRAELWQQQGDIEEAMADLNQAIRLDPAHVQAYRCRASLWEQLGKSDEAALDLDRADEIRFNSESSGKIMQNRKKSVYSLLENHFEPTSLDDVIVTERRFPARVRADVQRAIDRIVSQRANLRHFCGVRKRYHHDSFNFSEILVQDRDDPAVAIPPQFEEVDIGEQQTVRCLKAGLWLLEIDGAKCALFLEPPTYYGRMGGLRFQFATVNDGARTDVADTFFKELEKAVFESACYRGKILSLEVHEHYSGVATGITVHKLKTVARDQVILPRKTLELLERNVVHFVHQRVRLNELGISTKKGLLFYGPPGTGKTHTIHYLAGALKGHTTLLISAEQIGLLGEYMTLARLLQPSIVVIEDVDLIARDRGQMESVCEEVLLNKLLNEMDGLRPDADVLFVLTTNRPESLELALASRPGRVDQAIEFPLPDTEGREKLIRLYSSGMEVPEDVVQATARKTQNVSAAFIKELMRRAMQFHLERATSSTIDIEDVDNAIEELLFSGGTLNRKLLGAGVD